MSMTKSEAYEEIGRLQSELWACEEERDKLRKLVDELKKAIAEAVHGGGK